MCMMFGRKSSLMVLIICISCWTSIKCPLCVQYRLSVFFSGVVDFMVLCTDQSAVTVICKMYPLSGMRTHSDIHVGSPKELKSHLQEGTSVSLCAIGLQASALKQIALSNEWKRSDLGELLRTVQKAAGKKSHRKCKLSV